MTFALLSWICEGIWFGQCFIGTKKWMLLTVLGCLISFVIYLLATKGLRSQQRAKQKVLLPKYHHILDVGVGEKGRTNTVRHKIDTPQEWPIRQSARTIKQMENEGVIGPSICPWSSPVVMVRKRMGWHDSLFTNLAVYQKGALSPTKNWRHTGYFGWVKVVLQPKLWLLVGRDGPRGPG